MVPPSAGMVHKSDLVAYVRHPLEDLRCARPERSYADVARAEDTMDNLGLHKGEAVRDSARSVGVHARLALEHAQDQDALPVGEIAGLLSWPGRGRTWLHDRQSFREKV